MGACAVSISMVHSEKEALYCVLFHDVSDGSVLGTDSNSDR